MNIKCINIEKLQINILVVAIIRFDITEFFQPKVINLVKTSFVFFPWGAVKKSNM